MSKKHDTNRNDQKTHDLHQTVQRADHFRLFSGSGSFCFQCQLGNIRICSHFVQAGVTGAGDDKTAGHQRVSRLFCDLVRFSGEQGFIYLNFTVQHDSIGTHLIAGGEDCHIIQYDLICGENLFFSIADHGSFWSI